MFRHIKIVVLIALLPGVCLSLPPTVSDRQASSPQDTFCPIKIPLATTPVTYRCPRDQVEARHFFIIVRLQKCPDIRLTKDEVRVLVKLSQGKQETVEEVEYINTLLDRCKMDVDVKK